MTAADQIHHSRENDGDTRSATTDGAHRILSEQRGTTHNGSDTRTATAADTAALVQSHTLPELHIDGHDSHPAQQESGFMHFVHGTEAVVSDLARGAVDEVVHHPLQVIESAAAGLAIGTIAVLAAPGIATAAAAVGGLYGLYQLATHAGGWAHSADVVSNTQDHTAAEVAAAHQDLQGVGGGVVLIGAGAAGGFAAAPLAGVISEGIAGAAASAESGAIDSLNVRGGQELLEGPLTSAERAALTPEQIAHQESIAQNQSIFQQAHEQGQIIPSVKRSYQVRFERVGPGGITVPTLENPTEGITLPEGSWLATRLNADGTPNIENGIMNRWTITPRDITSRYLITPEQLAAAPSEITGFTNTSAAPVHMVRVDAPMDFQATWGPQHIDAGGWLANYDFNPATGQAGVDFAGVTARSYAQTYEPVTQGQ